MFLTDISMMPNVVLFVAWFGSVVGAREFSLNRYFQHDVNLLALMNSISAQLGAADFYNVSFRNITFRNLC